MDIIGCNNCGGKRPAFKRFPNVVDPMTGKHYNIDSCPECYPILKPFIGKALQNGASANGTTPHAKPYERGFVATELAAVCAARNEKQRQYRATHPRADRTTRKHGGGRKPQFPNETAEEKRIRKNAADLARYHARRDAAGKPKRGRPRADETLEQKRLRKLQKQRLARQAGWGNDMHVLRDGARVLLKGPPYRCGGDGTTPCDFKSPLFRALMRHANNHKHVVGKPVPA